MYLANLSNVIFFKGGGVGKPIILLKKCNRLNKTALWDLIAK